LHEAQWIAGDELTGLAVLKMKAGVAAPPPLATSLPPVGSWVMLIGNPFGLSHSVSLGVVSGLDRSVNNAGGISRGLIQFAAPVFPGDGGGLVADREGRMLGIVSTALREPGGNETSERQVQGIGFAIPAAEMRRIAQRLREGQPVERGYLGLTAEDVADVGIRVESVLRESPAQQAGILEGDVIEAMDNREVGHFDELAGRIERIPPGSKVTLRLMRSGERIDITTTLSDRPHGTNSKRRMLLATGPGESRSSSVERWRWDLARRSLVGTVDPESAVLGMHTQPVTESLAKSLGLPTREGALISGVVPGSASDRAGVRTSDVIMRLNDEAIRSPQQLNERMRGLSAGASVQFKVLRDGKQHVVDLKMPERKMVESWSGSGNDEAVRWFLGAPWPAASLRTRFEEFEERIRKLEARLEELQKRGMTR
jgi:serine protease Do